MNESTAPAKIILLGEHSVVYGEPAIAIPVSGLRATATVESGSPGSGLHIIARDLDRVFPVSLNADAADNALIAPACLLLKDYRLPLPDLNIVVRSQIPIASGLGSGAAISTVITRALAAALGMSLTAEAVNDLVYQTEKLHHGTPSGVDNTVIVYERPLFFVRGHKMDFLTVQGQYNFLIADTGVAALTRVAVGDVAKLYQSDAAHWEQVFHTIGELVRRARVALETGNSVELGLLMNQNHAYLQQLTVSSPELDHLVQAALNAGALGAKLSGGGRGGNMIALVTPDTRESVQAALLNAGAVRVFSTTLL
jgi:mevalonate kinase